MKLETNDIVYNGVIAALYVALTLITAPISFFAIQVRISEILVLLCFFRKNYIYGISFGCLVANTASTLGPIDMLIGTLATILSCICVMNAKHLAIAIIFPILFNAFIIAAEIKFFYELELDYWITALTVGIGETISMIVGYLIFFFTRKGRIKSIIRANQNLDFKL